MGYKKSKPHCSKKFKLYMNFWFVVGFSEGKNEKECPRMFVLFITVAYGFFAVFKLFQTFFKINPKNVPKHIQKHIQHCPNISKHFQTFPKQSQNHSKFVQYGFQKCSKKFKTNPTCLEKWRFMRFWTVITHGALYRDKQGKYWIFTVFPKQSW